MMLSQVLAVLVCQGQQFEGEDVSLTCLLSSGQYCYWREVAACQAQACLAGQALQVQLCQVHQRCSDWCLERSLVRHCCSRQGWQLDALVAHLMCLLLGSKSCCECRWLSVLEPCPHLLALLAGSSSQHQR